jgi:hypothetical protein
VKLTEENERDKDEEMKTAVKGNTLHREVTTQPT